MFLGIFVLFSARERNGFYYPKVSLEFISFLYDTFIEFKYVLYIHNDKSTRDTEGPDRFWK